MKTGVHKLVILALMGILVGAFVLIGGCNGTDVVEPPDEPPVVVDPIYETTTVVGADDVLEANRGNPDFKALDIRPFEEYAAGYFEGGWNVEYGTETFREDLDALDKTMGYLVYDDTGERAAEILALMEELGFSEAYYMEGTFAEAVETGLFHIETK